MKETAVVCCYRRLELLFCCLKRIREASQDIEILLFPDRGTWKDPRIKIIAEHFRAQVQQVPDHDYPGNSFNAGEALRFAHAAGYELIHYIEDDAMAKPDLFEWTRERHATVESIFCSAGWIFNLHSPIDSGDYFVPWVYIPQFSIGRKKLGLIVEHLRPAYYLDMQTYLSTTFPTCALNAMYPNVVHYEIDGLIQRVITQDRSQVAWPSVAKVEHLGFGGYNRGGFEHYEDFFRGLPIERFDERVERVEELIRDPYWRAEIFGRDIVEREIGRVLPKREYKYKIKLVGGWETTLTSEVKLASLPRRINSVDIPADAEIVLTS